MLPTQRIPRDAIGDNIAVVSVWPRANYDRATVVAVDSSGAGNPADSSQELRSDRHDRNLPPLPAAQISHVDIPRNLRVSSLLKCLVRCEPRNGVPRRVTDTGHHVVLAHVERVIGVIPLDRTLCGRIAAVQVVITGP